jgi:hypothetical protein
MDTFRPAATGVSLARHVMSSQRFWLRGSIMEPTFAL